LLNSQLSHKIGLAQVSKC